MASITIRNLDDDVKTQLRTRAAGNGRSMEEEARLILREAVGREAEPKNLAAFIPRVLRAFRRRGTRIAAARADARAAALRLRRWRCWWLTRMCCPS